MRTRLPWTGLAATVLACAGPVRAHEVHETVRQQVPAVVVSLRYADGEPFAGEQVEVYADGGARPVLSSRTDAQGRLVFLPDGARRWRVRGFSADGHGVDLSFDAAPAIARASTALKMVAPAVEGGVGGRALRIAGGMALVVLCVFGVRRLLRRQESADAHP